MAVYEKYYTVNIVAIISVLNGDNTDVNNLVSVSENKVVANNTDKTTVVSVPNSYSHFAVILSGLDVEKYADLSLAICAYSYDGEKVSYLNNEGKNIPEVFVLGDILK